MVLDSSAVIAWLRAEPEADAIVTAPLLFMSAFNVFETKTVISLRFPGASLSKFGVLLENLDVRILAFDAYLDFGRKAGDRRHIRR